MKVRLAMTVGDPRGIGPEVVTKALADSRVSERCDVVVIGPEGAGVKVAESIGHWRPGSEAVCFMRPAIMPPADSSAETKISCGSISP